MTTTTHLLYLHGFRSSPQSAKARAMADWAQRRTVPPVFWAPQLPPSPRDAITLLREGTADWPRETMAVVGSSLGGFYATWMAEHAGCRAVLLNPAVHPARDLARYIGGQTQWHAPAESFYFRPEYVDELRALECPPGQPPAAQVMAVIAKGDELLDWREMAGRYPGAQVRLLEGGDHALSDFTDHLDAIAAFLGLPGAATTP